MDKTLAIRHMIRKLYSSRKMAMHDYFNAFIKCRNEIEELWHMGLSDANVLILGCGYNYPDVTLWASLANSAVGVDVRTGFLRNRSLALNRSFKRLDGGLLESCVRPFVLRLTYVSYYDHLRNLSGIDLDEYRQNILTYDGTALPFADESFDIVCSNAVLEHVRELDVVSREMRRVMKPSGICFHLWHNFRSLSGAHVPEDVAIASPWGHLLGNAEVDEWLAHSGTYLNKYSSREIVDVLSRDFETLRINQLDSNHNRNGFDESFEYEGVALFTEDLANRLRRYSKADLLTRAYTFIGERR